MKQPAEHSIPQRHRLAVAWVGFAQARQQIRHSQFCGLCSKLALHSAEAARAYIALLMRSGQMARPNGSTFVPYPCPHLAGMWHAGHNSKLPELLTKTVRSSQFTVQSEPKGATR
jgi:hypothetical protein